MIFFRRLAVRPDDPILTAARTVNQPKHYMDDARNHEPVALIFMANWTAGLDSVGKPWWSRTWSKSAVQAFANLMEPQWVAYLEWPMKTVGLIG